MKKSLLLFGMSFAYAGMAFANGAGCGLGAVIFEGSSGTMSHLSAATTNGSSGSQTFGITSGTSGCDSDSTVQVEQKQAEFVATNLPQLMNDISRGYGIYLSSYGRLLGCSGDMEQFSSSLQKEMSSLTSGSVEASDVLEQTKTIIRNDAQLSSSCQVS